MEAETFQGGVKGVPQRGRRQVAAEGVDAPEDRPCAPPHRNGARGGDPEPLLDRDPDGSAAGAPREAVDVVGLA